IPNINEDNIEEIQTLVDEADVPVMYILNIKENNGFIVMSASTVEKPILAYANKGKFDLENINQYDGVNDWLAIKYLKITGLNRLENINNENTSNQWNAVGVHVS